MRKDIVGPESESRTPTWEVLEGVVREKMRGLLGEGAPLSKSSIRRLRAGWTAEFRNYPSSRRASPQAPFRSWCPEIASDTIK